MIESDYVIKPPSEDLYPKLVIHKKKGFIVLMTAHRNGIVVSTSYNDGVHKVGYQEALWDMDSMTNFVDFHGTVTLKQ